MLRIGGVNFDTLQISSIHFVSGDLEMQRRQLFSAAAAAAFTAVLSACGKKDGSAAASSGAAAAAGTVTIKVGATPVPHGDLLKVAAPLLEKQGVKLQIVEFNDYVQPNLALESKDLDANFFQHKPYLDDFQKNHKTHLAALAPIHIEPMGIYGGKSKDLKAIPKGAKIAIPNDPTNGGRALLLLQSAGVLKLKNGGSIASTPADIVENPHSIKLQELEAAQVPRSLKDVDFAVINSNFALTVNLNPVKDSLFIEKDSPYANDVVVRQGDENRPELQKLVRALQSPEVKKYIEDNLKGAVVPAF